MRESDAAGRTVLQRVAAKNRTDLDQPKRAKQLTGTLNTETVWPSGSSDRQKLYSNPPVHTTLGCIPEFRSGNNALVVISTPRGVWNLNPTEALKKSSF